MSRQFVCLNLLLVFALLQMSSVEAQIVRRILNRRAALMATPVDPNAPAPAPGAEAVPPAELPIRGGFFARRMQQRRDLVAQQAAEAQPTPAPATTPLQQPEGLAQRRTVQALRQASAIAAPAMRALTPADLAEMEVPALQTALSNTGGELSNELSRFTSAASWQNFFNMPTSVVDEQTIDLAALQTVLLRFEKVARDGEFTQIAELSSFNQARSILNELVNRVDVPATDGPQLIDPTGETQISAESEPLEESLPAPEPELPRNEGEHSILVRSGKR
ncbi:MAG: hypothetical protein SH868_03060 [Bythopirellula sp.]|nr:hypothetical protein [Bythopirellula sp.]